MLSMWSRLGALRIGVLAVALTMSSFVTPRATGGTVDIDPSTAAAASGGNPRSVTACALALGVIAASYIGTAVNPIGGYIGVVAGVHLFAFFC
jgi:hypothetical protein